MNEISKIFSCFYLNIAGIDYCILKYYRSLPWRKVDPAHLREVEAHPGPVKPCPVATEAHSGAAEAQPRVV
jgi:hypothetical protein